MNVYVIERSTGKMTTIVRNVTSVDQHFPNEFDVWSPDDKGNTCGQHQVVKINPKNQWVSVM